MEFLNVLKRLVLPINQKHEVPYDAALETFIPSVHKRLLYGKIDLFFKKSPNHSTHSQELKQNSICYN
jgi:hypothetical protein